MVNVPNALGYFYIEALFLWCAKLHINGHVLVVRPPLRKFAKGRPQSTTGLACEFESHTINLSVGVFPSTHSKESCLPSQIQFCWDSKRICIRFESQQTSNCMNFVEADHLCPTWGRWSSVYYACTIGMLHVKYLTRHPDSQNFSLLTHFVNNHGILPGNILWVRRDNLTFSIPMVYA